MCSWLRHVIRPQPQDAPVLKGCIAGLVMNRAGSRASSANRSMLLRNTDGAEVADLSSELLDGLNSLFGVALVGDSLYVVTADSVLCFPYAKGETSIAAPAVTVPKLQCGPINHRWTKNLIASPDATRLHVTVG